MVLHSRQMVFSPISQNMSTPSFSCPSHLSACSHHHWCWPPLASTVEKVSCFLKKTDASTCALISFLFIFSWILYVSYSAWFLSFQSISYICFNELNLFPSLGTDTYITERSWRFLIPFFLLSLLERSLYTYSNSSLLSNPCFNKPATWLWWYTEAWEPLPGVHTCGPTKKLTIIVINREHRL